MTDKISKYADNQRREYNLHGVSFEGAKALVAPNYDEVRIIANGYAHLVLSQYQLRQGQFYDPDHTDISGLKLFDFGCGVGRVMEAFHDRGCRHIDGCDISHEMLKHASKSPLLTNSRFYLSDGADAGDAPAANYNIAYSFLCMHHIPMRQTRIKILESLAHVLRDDGMVFIELKMYPGATPAKIPVNHAHWTENMIAKETNSKNDVWITPDSLGMVYEDFRLFFQDVAILDLDRENVDHYTYQPEEVYQLGFNEMFVVASKRPSLRENLVQLATMPTTAQNRDPKPIEQAFTKLKGWL